MRIRIILYSMLGVLASVATALLVFSLLSSLGPTAAYWGGGAAGVVCGLLFSFKTGERAVNRQILSLLKARDMAKSVAREGKVTYLEPDDYEVAHPVKFIYNELKSVQNQLAVLRGELAKHERLFDNIQEGLIIADSEGNVITLNPAAKSIFRVPDIKGDMKLMHIIYDTKTLMELDAVTSGEKESGETTLALRKGKTYNVKIYRIDLQGKNDGIIIFARDITEIIAADRIRRDFVANVSHELKTPLTSIRGFSEMLISGHIEDEGVRSQYLTLIITEAERLSSLINDVLKLSELESIALDEGKTRVDLSEHAGKAVQLVLPLAQKHGVTVTCDASPCLIFANPVRVDELFLNLIDNAVKYNKENGTVSVYAYAEGGDAVLRVQDTGIGIPDADRSRIFERFYRVDKSRSRQSGGTGLGLSIVKHIAELYKGRLLLTSKEGEGTSIEIRFPLVAPLPASGEQPVTQ